MFPVVFSFCRSGDGSLPSILACPEGGRPSGRLKPRGDGHGTHPLEDDDKAWAVSFLNEGVGLRVRCFDFFKF